MSIFVELLLIAAVVVFIVDLSGWTQTWLGWLSAFTARFHYPPVRSLRPFSCSTCMVWWCGLGWAWWSGSLTWLVAAYIAGLSFFSITLRELFIFIQESLTGAIARLNRWLND